MRQRAARMSHGIEFFFGSGSAQYQSGISWPTGARMPVHTVDVPAGGLQVLDVADYRDRWLIMFGQVLDFNEAIAFGVTSFLPGDVGDVFNWPHETNWIPPREHGVFRGDCMYTSLGWDGTVARGIGNQNYAQFLKYTNGQPIEMYVSANNATGSLELRNKAAMRYQGFFGCIASEILGKRIIIP